MSTVFSEMDQRPKDAILLFEIGFHTQLVRKSADGLTKARLSSTLAAILWHWEELQKTEEFRGIHNWGIYHKPFRFGDVVYRPIVKFETSATVPFDILLIDEIIKGDPHMQALIPLTSLSGFEEDNFYFPVPDLKDYQKLKASADIEALDIDLATVLALIYGSVETTDELSILATCSNEEHAYKAMEAEIRIWHHDVKDIFDYLFEYRHHPIGIQDSVAKCLEDAFKCGEQIGIKRKWYSRAGHVAASIISHAKGRYPDNLLEPLTRIQSHPPSSRMKNAEKAAQVLTGLIGFSQDLLSEIGLRVNLPPEYATIARQFETRLYDTAGFPTGLTDKAHEVAGSRNTMRAYELTDYIKQAYDYVQNYLREASLPDAYS